MTDRDMNMVHYPVFAEPFVLVVIRGALDMLQLIQPQVADIPLARAACGWGKPSHRRSSSACGQGKPSHRRSQHQGYNTSHASHAINTSKESVMWLGLEEGGCRRKKTHAEDNKRIDRASKQGVHWRRGQKYRSGEQAGRARAAQLGAASASGW